MLYIIGNAIKLTRGDTAYLTIPLTLATGEEYIMQPADELVLSVKEHVLDTQPIMQKRITGGNIFHIEPNDTANLFFGKYQYDIQLNTASGDVYTVIDVDTFEILQEVTC